MTLVLGTLSIVQETLASLGSMSSIAVSNICFLAAEITRKMLLLKWLVAEPEILLREDETPEEIEFSSVMSVLCKTWRKHT